MSFCANCIKGVTHEGTPKGEMVKIGGVDCYVATPTMDYPKDKAILYLSDAFGVRYNNAQLMADDFAANGFKTIIPDYMNGDPVPTTALNSGSKFDLPAWLKSHQAEHTRPPLDSVIAALKEQGIAEFGATGYCFGARYVFDLAFDNIIKASVVSHPSFLKVPDDLEKYISKSTSPLLINSCTVDSQFPLSACTQADDLFGGGKFAPGYRREHFEGCEHGFAVRGDLTDPRVKEGKEGAFRSAVEWFIANL